MGSPAFKFPPGFIEETAPAPGPGLVQGQTADIPSGTTEFTPPAAAQFQLPPGFEQVGETPPAEAGYFEQVKDGVASMVRDMYDAWDKGDFPKMTGIPQTIMGLNKQYYETLPQSRTTSEFLYNLIPIFGPVLNEAAAAYGAGKPKTGAAMLTTDLMLPLLAEKLPAAALKSLPASVTKNVPTRLMHSSLKPTISKFEKVAAASEQAVETAIDMGIPTSEGGLIKLTNTIRSMNKERNAIFKQAPKPEMILEPKTPQRALPQGGAPDYELGPTVPPPGTKQTVLSHARGQLTPPSGAKDMGEFMGGIRESYTAESVRPGVVRLNLEQAGNQQLIQEINRRAQESGLLDAVQEAARKANQPVPYDISELFNITFKNVVDPRTSKNIAARLEQVKRRYISANPETELAAIDAAAEEFFRNYPGPMGYREAQAVRTGTSRKLGQKAYTAQRNVAGVEAERAIERGIMDDLKEALPELQDLNPKEAKALGLLPELRRAIGRTKNWELWSGIVGGSAAVVGGSIGTALGGGTIGAQAASASALIALALRDPMVKSKLAIAINRAQQLHPKKHGAPNLASARSKVSVLQEAVERAAAGIIPAATIDAATEEEDQP